MEIQYICLEWMLDFDLERAKERLSVLSNMCHPSPHSPVIYSSPGHLWLIES